MSPLAIAQYARDAGSSWTVEEIHSAIGTLSAAAVVAFLVYRFARRVPWPRPFRLRFAILNVAAALACGTVWFALAFAIESLFTGSLAEVRVGGRFDELIVLGLFLYAVAAGITYSMESSARAARAEAAAARTQLASLRAQIHPHFLFNALHTVVQLIPVDPGRAAEAAEIVASLLRTSLEEERDEVTLEDEWAFVSRYLEIEHIRFGERLRVRADVDPELLGERLPSFALQTLVENAVQHGAAPRVSTTDIVVTASVTASELTLTVRDTGERMPSGRKNGTGTGLSRLKERLAFLYGGTARLKVGSLEEGGFEAILVVPRRKP